jgi:hypothetical protein
MDQIKAVFTQLLFVGLMGILSLSVYGNYDPTTGRFLQRDPLRYVDGMNLYEYVKSNTLVWADPMGTMVAMPDGGGYTPPGGWPKDPDPKDKDGINLDQLVDDFLAWAMEAAKCAESINNAIPCGAACVGDCTSYLQANWIAAIGLVPNTIPPVITGKLKNCCPIPRKEYRGPFCVPNTTNWQNAFQALSSENKKLFGLKLFQTIGRVNVGTTIFGGALDSAILGYCTKWCIQNPGKQQYNHNIPMK